MSGTCQNRSSSPAQRPWSRHVLTVCGLLLGIAGCASGPQGEMYTVDQLPQNMVAMRRDNAKTIDLSRLSSAVANSDIIDKGDVLQVQIAAGLSEKDIVTVTVRVRDDGQAELPNIGSVPVAGMDMASAEAAISTACIERQLYRSPNVTVTMKQQRTNKVTVVGAVKEPGVKSIPRGSSDLLAALVAAGGLADDAGTNVEIRNPRKVPLGDMNPPIASSDPDGVNSVGFSVAADPVSSRMESIKVDLISATKAGNGGYQVTDGAVVMVEKRDPEPVHVLGLVRTPNRYEFPIGQDLRVLDALALAGGISNPVANTVYIVRKKPDSSETAIVKMSVSDAKRRETANVRLSPGDVVSVEQTPATVLIDALKLINFGLGASVPLF
ncbi:MAG TPA: polysaccharide biosynthesis/export family protein [Planctomycetaceae bacterium]|nr:polysaccharide biosynthesis/export family protein [Planctomycetaceae bacterium]